MAGKEHKCPTCDGEMLLEGDERPGDQIFCPTCQSPAKLVGDAESEECDVEADY